LSQPVSSIKFNLADEWIELEEIYRYGPARWPWAARERRD
jgi:hypothetical protein